MKKIKNPLRKVAVSLIAMFIYLNPLPKVFATFPLVQTPNGPQVSRPPSHFTMYCGDNNSGQWLEEWRNKSFELIPNWIFSLVVECPVKELPDISSCGARPQQDSANTTQEQTRNWVICVSNKIGDEIRQKDRLSNSSGFNCKHYSECLRVWFLELGVHEANLRCRDSWGSGHCWNEIVIGTDTLVIDEFGQICYS